MESICCMQLFYHFVYTYIDGKITDLFIFDILSKLYINSLAKPYRFFEQHIYIVMKFIFFIIHIFIIE